MKKVYLSHNNGFYNPIENRIEDLFLEKIVFF